MGFMDYLDYLNKATTSVFGPFFKDIYATIILSHDRNYEVVLFGETGWFNVFKDYFRDIPIKAHDKILSIYDTFETKKLNTCFLQYMYANFYKNMHLFKRNIDVNTMLVEWVDFLGKGVWANQRTGIGLP